MSPSGFLRVPAPTGTEAARFDAWAQRACAIPGPLLMENAGRAGADLVEAWVPTGPVTVLAGVGNNGGDAVVLARTLFARGRTVRLFSDPRRPNPDPLLHGHPLVATPVSAEAIHAAGPTAIWVDGLLGTGLRGAPRDPVAGWITALNERVSTDRAGFGVLALDVASGIDADTGAVPGVAVRAQATAAFGAPKLGGLLHPARAQGGRIVALEIGFPPWGDADARCTVITESLARAALPRRALRTHKNAAGRMLLLAGGTTMAGAALFAARGAFRAGVGMLRVLTDPGHRAVLQEQVPEAVLPDLPTPAELEKLLRSVDVVVAGPGMGLDLLASGSLGAQLAEAFRIARELGPEGPAWLFDADALTLLGRGELPEGPDPAQVPVLLTPHAGEMARLLPANGLDPFEVARACAARWGGTVLYKGTPSVVVTAGTHGEFVSASGSTAFARAGMGDVLAGVAGAFMARGASAPDSAALALHLTGRAAEFAMRGEGEGAYRGGPPDTLLPSDLIEALPMARRELDGVPAHGSVALASVFFDLSAPS